MCVQHTNWQPALVAAIRDVCPDDGLAVPLVQRHDFARWAPDARGFVEGNSRLAEDVAGVDVSFDASLTDRQN